MNRGRSILNVWPCHLMLQCPKGNPLDACDRAMTSCKLMLCSHHNQGTPQLKLLLIFGKCSDKQHYPTVNTKWWEQCRCLWFVDLWTGKTDGDRKAQNSRRQFTSVQHLEHPAYWWHMDAVSLFRASSSVSVDIWNVAPWGEQTTQANVRPVDWRADHAPRWERSRLVSQYLKAAH